MSATAGGLGRRLGPYVLDRRIGSGGMAEVFLAHQLGVEGFQRPVAIKTINGHGVDRDSVRLFLDEARAASGLEHPGIVRTLDLGYDDDTLYIVMDYVEGPPLSRILRSLKERNRALRAPLVAYLGWRVAQALDYAHHRAATGDGRALHLIHRDVSPQNILVNRQGGVLLTDFGIARSAVQHHVTRTGMVRGKAAYMAPEQVLAQAMDGRVDVFALGLVLYEALTLHRPFERSDEVASMRAVVRDPVPLVGARVAEVPPALEALIAECLQKKAEDRPARAEAVAKAFEPILRDHSTVALEQGWAQLVTALYGEGVGDGAGPAHQDWHPTVPAHAGLRATPSTPSTPSGLAEILVELSPAPARPMLELGAAVEAHLAPAAPSGFEGPPPTELGSQSQAGTGSRGTLLPWLGLLILVILGGVLAGLLLDGPARPLGTPPPPVPVAPAASSPVAAAPSAQVGAPAQVRVLSEPVGGGSIRPEPAPVRPPPPVHLPPPVHPPPLAQAPPAPARGPAPSKGPPSALARKAPIELEQLRLRLEACEREDASPRSIVALGEAIEQAARRVPDATQRARIVRSAQSSANLGEVAGLRRAYEALRRSWPSSEAP